MITPLLKTKLYIPQPRANLVPRPQLTARLDAGLSGKLTLVSAPAGFGKTTLVSEWIRQKAHNGKQGEEVFQLSSVAWLSLDEGDNDQARFLAYLIASLRTIPELEAAKIGEALLQAFQSPGVGKEESQSTTALLTELINEITVHGPAFFILVLDDYHLITLHKIHDTLAFLVDNLPPNMHLIIATRADLPIQVARLRGGGQLNELRLAELRFENEEAAAFLNQVMNLDLDAVDIQALNKRTEGWIAGLQMASLALRAKISAQGQENIHPFVRAFTGSNRYVLDYLVEEVFQQQSEQVQTFLLQTSVLERLSAPLCEALINDGADDEASTTQSYFTLNTCQEILEYLDQANLFLIPMDDQREWYRYHRLFADLLRQRLRQEYPQLVGSLHTRASVWFEKQGILASAIDHALAGKDFERGADLLETNIEPTLMRGEIPTALRWLDALPDELVCSKPGLCLYYAWALMLTGRPIGEIEAQLDQIHTQDNFITGGVDALRGFLNIFQLRFDSAQQHAHQALARLPQEATFMRGVAAWTISLAELTIDDPKNRRVILNEILRVSQELGNLMIVIWTLAQIARQHMHEGDLKQAEEVYQRALEVASDNFGQQLPVAGIAQMGLGKIHYEWNRLETALQYLESGIENSLRWREIAAMNGYLTLARLRQAQQDFSSAQDALNNAARLALKFDAAEWDDQYVALFQARFLVAQGKLDDALAALRKQEAEIGLPSEIDPGLEEKYSQHMLDYLNISLAHAFILQGQPEQALDLLKPVLEHMIERERIDYTIEVQTLLALAHQAIGDDAAATTALETALSLAEPGGYVRVFLEKGKPLRSILTQMKRTGEKEIYADLILQAFEQADSDRRFESKVERQPPLIQKSEQSLVDPLSEREIEVLRFLQTNLSTPEIADEMVIAVSTVRTHIKNIYSKLGVHSRTQAVDQAKDLGII
jgi:LuxR family maltose regulon positive regulatory protein